MENNTSIEEDLERAMYERIKYLDKVFESVIEIPIKEVEKMCDPNIPLDGSKE